MERRQFLSRAGAGLALALLPPSPLLPSSPSPPADRHREPPRPGLSRCPECGEWRGEARGRDGDVRRVHCRCDPSLCPRCGEVVHPRRIGAHYWSEERGAPVHVPVLVGMTHSCRHGP